MSVFSNDRLRHVAAAGVAAGASAAVATVVCAFALNGHTWRSHQASYYVNAANLDIPEADAEAAIRAGADAWALQTDADVSLVYAGRTTGSSVANNGKNEVFFRNESNGNTIAVTYYWWDGSGNLVDADILFYDGGFQFFGGSSGCTSGQYVQDVATHEFGHVIGISHSGDSSATMYPSTTSCSQNWRSLAADDVSAAETAYPPAGATPPPSAPSNLTVGVNASSPSSAIDVRWSDNSSNESNFLVERSTDGFNFTQVASLGANVTAFTNSGLAASTTYTYRVRASNGGGFSAYSDVASATTSAPPPPTVPSVPAGPSPAASAVNVNVDADLAWSCSGATSYDVYLGLDPNPTSYRTVTSPSLVLDRMSAGTTYYWRVVARNSAGLRSSPTWSFTTRTRTGKQRSK
jgi:hypothetical protein